MDYNHAAAFVAFTRGTSADEIAQTFAIPLSTVLPRAGAQ